MRCRKLIEVLTSLNPEQIERLSEFIRSPYFNKSVSIASLFDYLKSLHPAFPAAAVANEALVKRVPGINDQNILAKKVTRLLDLVEKFLSIECNHDPVMEKIGTLKAYKKLHLVNHFEGLMRQLRKDLKNEPFHDFEYLWKMHKLEEECFEGFDKRILRTPDNSLDEVFTSLTRFYLTKKLRYAVEAVLRERVVGNKIGNEIKDEMNSFLNQHKEDEDLYVLLYGNIFKMNLENSPEKALENYRRIKAALKAFQNSLPPEEIRSICHYLQNYCITLINKGTKHYLKEFFEIIQFRINKGILTEEGKLEPQLFKNIVTASIKLNEISWAKGFIKKFKRYLPPEFRNDYYNLAAGQLYYQQKEYTKACRHLAMASHNKTDVYFSFTVKKLLLKIGFESEDIFLLLPFIESYKKHLQRYRNKIGENAPILEKFFRYFRYLVNADREKTEILLSRLLAEENFADKDWLISMASRKLRRHPTAAKHFKKELSAQLT